MIQPYTCTVNMIKIIKSRLMEANIQNMERVIARMPGRQLRALAAGRGQQQAWAKYLLSDREVQILRHLSYGLTSADLASRLRLSTDTIDTHRKNITRKLEVNNIV